MTRPLLHNYDHRYTFSGAQCSISFLCILILVCQFIGITHGFDKQHSASLRKEVEDLFYHGFDNYMSLAFPEDELRPISCVPLGRDVHDPYHFEINDALANYSLTLIDSLSTLAILASAPPEGADNKPLRLYQDGIKEFVRQYGDGAPGPSGQGAKARGFDLDSKVQVFETSIRGLGGLLSAHLFAVGDLPIRGYHPLEAQANFARSPMEDVGASSSGIEWPNGFVYNGQLLRLAHDLGQRLIPAFWTSTGLPYPRVNLRRGIPFYENSPHNYNPIDGQCGIKQGQNDRKEVTETCSAGAGSLLLEFIVLSRLTADDRFEELAKRAFWSVWNRRSEINLVGAGIDAETGVWSNAFTGIGAGIDSFFEYAFKTYILLSNDVHPKYNQSVGDRDPRILFEPLTAHEHSADSFLEVWEQAHFAIERHLSRGAASQHHHYIQVDLNTGAARFFWIDSLSAFWSGLLTLAGHVEQAIKSHLLFTALWTRFSALPERWSLNSGGVEGGLGWWPGRPEFIESNYYLYRATEDPWYKYVAEMTLRDIKRRCWTRCGWASIQNVLTGELTDRMESFFLGETAKYLFLTFDDDHPLNHLDAPYVFSTEGHPLIIPRSIANSPRPQPKVGGYEAQQTTCPVRQANVPFSISSTAAREDVYHAASLARLHHMPAREEVSSMAGAYAIDHPSITISDTVSPSNYTYFPWTLPVQLVPANAMTAALRTSPTFDISFPSLQNTGQSLPPLQRVKDGILVNFVGGIRLSLIQDVPARTSTGLAEQYRVYGINSIFLGKDEKVFLPRHSGFDSINANDPIFTRLQDPITIDLVIDLGKGTESHDDSNRTSSQTTPELQMILDNGDSTMRAAWKSLVSQIASLMPDSPIPLPFTQTTGETAQGSRRASLRATTSSGKGAAPLPDWPEAPSLYLQEPPDVPLLWDKIYTTDELCEQKLPITVPRQYQVLVVKRGKCSFSQKLTKIPIFIPSAQSLQLVVVVSYGTEDSYGIDEDTPVQPHLDEWQETSSGLLRQNPIPMVLVTGGSKTYEALKGARGIGIRRRYSVRSQGVPITNLIIT